MIPSFICVPGMLTSANVTLCDDEALECWEQKWRPPAADNHDSLERMAGSISSWNWTLSWGWYLETLSIFLITWLCISFYYEFFKALALGFWSVRFSGKVDYLKHSWQTHVFKKLKSVCFPFSGLLFSADCFLNFYIKIWKSQLRTHSPRRWKILWWGICTVFCSRGGPGLSAWWGHSLGF